MDSLLEVLRSSTDNNARKAAAAQLRQVQTEQPDAFLQHTFDGIASPQLTPELRFFLCTVVLAFLEETWHSGVSPASQERFIALYVNLLTTQSFPSIQLARKVATIVAVMARRGARKAPVGALPPLIRHVVTRYVTELESASASQAYDRVCLLLLAIHLFLKDMQCSRVGRVFEDVSRAVVTPLSGVFALLPNAAAMLAHYDVCLHLLKCSLRSFGRATFEPAFCRFLLATSWQLAEGLGHPTAHPSQDEQRLRLLEYALKIMESIVVYFPGRLQELGVDFFVVDSSSTQANAAGGIGGPSSPAPATSSSSACAAAASPPQSLCALLAAVVRSPVGTVVSEKAVCRALRIFTALLSAEDGDAFIAHCLTAFATSPSFTVFLQHAVSAYLADDVTAEALAEWSRQPERVAAELDVDMDDEASMMGCTEQLFLAFTGSTGCAAPALTAAWAVVSQLLQDSGGDVASVTAALHAIGIGYYTMASQDHSSYLTFLREKLLPLLQPETLAQASPFVARRVVWLVGMWCESVTDTCDRHAVLAALEAVLQHAVHTRNVVLVLVSLKSTENFISDNNFALSDMTATLVATVLRTVEMLLSAAQSPTTVKELAGLVHVLTEKGAIQGHGEILVQLFVSPTQAVIQSYEAKAAAASAGQSALGLLGGDNDEDDDDEGNSDFLGSLGMLLDCLGSGVRQCGSDGVIWSLFPAVVLPCTSPACAATPWAEDNAWELFLAMAQSSHAFDGASSATALQVALQHTHRDFGMLPVVFRVVYTLLVLRQDAVEDILAAADVAAWCRILHESPSAELCAAVTAVLAAVARLSGGPLRASLTRHAVDALLSSTDVQAEQHTLPLAVALALCLASASSAEAQQRWVGEVHTAAQARSGSTPATPLSTLLEQVVLLLDVSPSTLVSCALARLLYTLRATSPHALSVEDAAMVQRALEGVEASVAEPTAACDAGQGGTWPSGEEEGERRSPQEMLLEWLGDEDVPPNSPHVARLMTTFTSLLS